MECATSSAPKVGETVMILVVNNNNYLTTTKLQEGGDRAGQVGGEVVQHQKFEQAGHKESSEEDDQPVEDT